MQQFMNQAASPLANKKEVQGAEQNGRTLQADGDKDKERTDQLIFLWGMEGVYQVDYFTAADQEIPDGLV